MQQPVFLNLLQIRLPIMGVVSILHRVSGVLLFLCIPALLYVFALSLSGEEGFQTVSTLLDSLLFRLLGIVLLWCLLHHLLAGFRFLLLDLDVGVERRDARVSAYSVLMGGAVLAVIAGLLL